MSKVLSKGKKKRLTDEVFSGKVKSKTDRPNIMISTTQWCRPLRQIQHPDSPRPIRILGEFLTLIDD
jgi:hypothetical protein